MADNSKGFFQSATGIAISLGVLFVTVWAVSKAWKAGQKQINMDVSKALTSVGAVFGLYYGVTKNKGFWGTAGLTLLCAIGGAALGTFYESVKKQFQKK